MRHGHPKSPAQDRRACSSLAFAQSAPHRRRCKPSLGHAVHALAPRWESWAHDVDPEDRVDDIRDPFLSALVNSMTCRLVASFRFSRKAHVNVQEAVALRTAVKAACRGPMLCGSRISFLVDSLVNCAVDLDPW
eukprot:6473116-Amphidinium_carterae.1